MALIAPVPTPQLSTLGAVHFIAIGGAGMSGVARSFLSAGVPVSGSDQVDSDILTELRLAGATIWVGHDPSHLDGVDTVVVSTAIGQHNCELVEARRRGLTILHRSVALACLMGDSTVISVAGTHGKTTTTALCILGLTGAGEDPSYVVGGTLLNTGTGSYQSTSELFVVEADESDGSFRQYPTTIAVITGVEADHLDNWETESNYIQGFVDFASGPTVTHVVLCYDDPGARGLIETIQAAGKTVLTYGTHPLADLQLTDVDPRNGRATLTTPTGQTHLKLRVHGLHNLLNATASCGVGHILGLDQEKFLSGVGSFLGTHRRFQTIGEIRGITVIDDYAHHPTEVEATIAAAKLQARGGKIIVCFQPHLYSRTLKFSQEFGRALADAGEVVVLDVYPAREEPIDGVTGDMVAQEVKRYGTSVHYVENMDDAPDVIARLAGPSDLVITMGAGSVTQLGPRILCALEV